MKVLILDIGNTHTKCYVFEVTSDIPDIHGTAQLHEERLKTNRGHPWDLADTVRNMLTRAINAHKPDYGMTTAFGDAFVHYNPADNGRPHFVFADEPVASTTYELDAGYVTTGFPTGHIEISGVRSLRLKHHAEWLNIVPVNIAIGIALGGTKTWRRWDLTQASASGDYDLMYEHSARRRTLHKKCMALTC